MTEPKIHVRGSDRTGWLEEHGHFEKLYYITPSKERWRVYDRAYDGTKWSTWCPPTTAALKRQFVSESGERRIYTFTQGETKELSPSRVYVQLQQARVTKR